MTNYSTYRYQLDHKRNSFQFKRHIFVFFFFGLWYFRTEKKNTNLIPNSQPLFWFSIQKLDDDVYSLLFTIVNKTNSKMSNNHSQQHPHNTNEETQISAITEIHYLPNMTLSDIEPFCIGTGTTHDVIYNVDIIDSPTKIFFKLG